MKPQNKYLKDSKISIKTDFYAMIFLISFAFISVFKMDYNQSIAYLMDRLPMFSKSGSSAFKPGLENIQKFCKAIHNPQEKFPSIHVAGTNGKGSVCHLLSAAFQNCGYKVGLYTSPHLSDFRERFRINGQPVNKEKVADFINQHQQLIEEIGPSYFELSVAMAFDFFAEEKVDIAIIETGLGGRLDSTNIIVPELSVITQISYDHTDILGDTLEKIAAEKAGIIKTNTPIVIGEKQTETTPVFEQYAHQKNAKLYFAENLWDIEKVKNQYSSYKATQKNNPEKHSFETDLYGVYQQKNIRTALAAIDILSQSKWQLPLDKVFAAFSNVQKISGLKGRWEIIQKQPKIILEVAHNIGGMDYLQENLKRENLHPNGKLRILLGFVKGKDVHSIMGDLPKNAVYYFTQADVPRALSADELESLAKEFNLKGRAFHIAEDALKQVIADLQTEDILLVTGSFYVIGEILPDLNRLLGL